MTRTSPDIEKTLKVSHGAPRTSRMNRLTSPALGLNRYTNAMATRNGGVMYAIVAVRWMKRLPGTSVRVTAQAIGSPMATLRTAVQPPSTSEFHRAVT